MVMISKIKVIVETTQISGKMSNARIYTIMLYNKIILCQLNHYGAISSYQYFSNPHLSCYEEGINVVLTDYNNFYSEELTLVVLRAIILVFMLRRDLVINVKGIECGIGGNQTWGKL